MKVVSEKTIKKLIKFKGSCCNLCHEGFNNHGYDLIWIDLDKDRETYVCCEIFNAFEEYNKNKR